ncbi:hypothetical protein F4821DRAFT_149887 [Hypoxylon rubiginosum]|uniref:Uncharacterized protein n=1 Tax=Hypoxylon rubiginosum TaxID=110542 RepID=A0ACC0CYF7_9PEZI|nr:hypothetical protein F4821DRAFT_149887 [Hypoxylon rubiginosum]
MVSLPYNTHQPNMSSFSDQLSLNDRCSEQDQESLGDYYTGNYTSDRPPHLNDDNFSSTQPGGSAYEPRRLPSTQQSELHGLHVTAYAGTQYTSSNTNSTVKGGDPFAHRPHLGYYVQHDYSNLAAPSLTTQAVAALDYSNETQPSYGNVNGWLPGAGFSFTANLADNNSSVEYLPVSSSSGRHSSVATNQSWTVVPAASDPMAESINGIGEWQTDIAADPKTFLARTIPDEDTQDHP